MRQNIFRALLLNDRGGESVNFGELSRANFIYPEYGYVIYIRKVRVTISEAINVDARTAWRN